MHSIQLPSLSWQGCGWCRCAATADLRQQLEVAADPSQDPQARVDVAEKLISPLTPELRSLAVQLGGEMEREAFICLQAVVLHRAIRSLAVWH